MPSTVYYLAPMYLQTGYAAYPNMPGSYPVAETRAGRVLSLPMHPYISESDQDRERAAVRAGC